MKRTFQITVFSFLAFLMTSNFDVHAQRVVESRRDYNKKNVRSTRYLSKNVTYKTPKRKVVSLRTLPRHRVLVTHRGNNFYFANNRFYTYSRGRYTVIPPRVGFRLNRLPVGYRTIRHLNRTYFWLNGIFYNQRDNFYEVVEPELGTIIYELPSNVERVTINNFSYYEFNNVLYEKIQVRGTRAYEVVGFIDQ